MLSAEAKSNPHLGSASGFRTSHHIKSIKINEPKCVHHCANRRRLAACTTKASLYDDTYKHEKTRDDAMLSQASTANHSRNFAARQKTIHGEWKHGADLLHEIMAPRPFQNIPV